MLIWSRVRTEPSNAGDQDDGSMNDSESTSTRSFARSGNTTVPGPSHSGAVSERDSMFEAWGIRNDVFKAETLWKIHSFITHTSFNFNVNTCALSKVMFPVSPIANQFSFGANKMSYLAAFSIAPFFTEKLYHSLSKAQYYDVSSVYESVRIKNSCRYSFSGVGGSVAGVHYPDFS